MAPNQISTKTHEWPRLVPKSQLTHSNVKHGHCPGPVGIVLVPAGRKHTSKYTYTLVKSSGKEFCCW